MPAPDLPSKHLSMSTAPPSNETPGTEPVRPGGRRLKRLILLIAVPLVGALAVTIVYLESGRQVETDNAYVQADMVPISTDVSGTVQAVVVRENQTVAAGDTLLRIDPASFEVAVAKAAANLAQVRTDIQALRASYREKQAEIALSRTKSAFARKEQQRQADLLTRHFISAARFDDAKQRDDLAIQQTAALEQDLRRIAETLGGAVNVPIEDQASYRAALAELERARLDLARTQVRAPLPGTVSRLPKPGQYLTAGNTAMALVASGNLWIEANFTETDLTYVHPGQPAVIHIDTYPDTSWKGAVESLSPATGAEFSVIPAQNATGNWVKIAQRVPVRIRLYTSPGMPQLRAGLSAVVRIDTGHHRHLLGFSL
jgi:membrane fusion protein (multidrug efflux system)